MEFLFSLGLVFLIFIMLLFVIIDKQIEINDSKETLGKLSECQRFANMITAIASSNEGISAEFSTEYYIKIVDSGMIYANDENNNVDEVSCTYIANPLSHNIYGNVKIQKEGGQISIN